MKIKPAKATPALIVFSALLLLIVLRVVNPDLFDRIERMIFDLRVRTALHFPPPVATNLGFVFINEESVERVADGSVGFHVGLLWPRQVYARLVNELTEQGAEVIAMDVLFGELRTDQPTVELGNGGLIDSDQIFAHQLRQSSNTILAVTTEKVPPLLFRTNALALGDITTEKDSDGVLRRVKVFRTYYDNWHPIFTNLAKDYGVDLNKIQIESDRLTFSTPDGEQKIVPLDKDGTFDVSDFLGDKIPPGMARRAKPCEQKRIWHMGIVLAATHLKLDLEHPEINLPAGRITLHGPDKLERVIPVTPDGYFYVDWTIPPNHPALTEEAIHDLLKQNYDRLQGTNDNLANRWRGKLAVVGSSSAVGNNLADVGATPFSAHTLLVSKHWNVANSILTGRFIARTGLSADAGLVALLGFVIAGLAWQAKILRAAFYAVSLCILYVFIAFALYIQSRLWLPIFFPLLSALSTFVALITWRLVFEEAERRRIKGVFSTVVSEKIMKELLEAEDLRLGGARRHITVMFADVRGFTELTDTSQARVAEYVRSKNLSGPAAESRFDQQARETLDTVNTYLGLVADIVLKHDATLDKFIGDCVMAFWGAPTPQMQHGLLCVRAAIEAQRAVHELNRQRAIMNQKLEIENLARISAGLETKPLLPILLLGTGINTGMVTVGMMGSGARQKNYTVFGREVNLASRLEGLSGRGRIFISQSTWQQLQRDDPALAATCVAQPVARVKGISADIIVYEVPWQSSGMREQEVQASAAKTEDSKAAPTIIQRG